MEPFKNVSINDHETTVSAEDIITWKIHEGTRSPITGAEMWNRLIMIHNPGFEIHGFYGADIWWKRYHLTDCHQSTVL